MSILVVAGERSAETVAAAQQIGKEVGQPVVHADHVPVHPD